MALLVIILMLILSAFFSGSEIAFVAANRLRVEVRARQRGRVGEVVRGFLETPSTFLTTTLVGNNVALVIYSTLMAFYLEPPLHHWFSGFIEAEAAVDISVLIAQTFVAALVVLFFGEILPKSIMRELSNRMVFVLAYPLRVTYYVLLPMVKLAGWTASQFVRLFAADAATFSQFVRRDFEILIQETKESGELDIDEEGSELLENVFALGSIRVKESMVPRTDVVAVEQNTTLEELRQKFISSGLSKLPVYQDNIDHIVGVVFAYDMFQEPESLAAMMRPAKYVPESKLSKDLLQEFLEAGTSIAVVIDEYGGTAGVVTREDLLEELFGDIQDEFDVEDIILRQVNEGVYVVGGRVELDELHERFDLVLPEGEYETVAGYLLERIGSIPTPQEEYTFDGYRFVILQATASRIDLVRIIREAK